MKHSERKKKERKIREKEIIDAALKIFGGHGFEKTSMNDVCLKAGFTKRTIYQYFKSKEDLYFAVADTAFLCLISYFETAFQNGKNGLEKISNGGRAYYKFYQEQPRLYKITRECTYIKTSKQKNSRSTIVAQRRATVLEMFYAAIETGKADGSIRPELDSKKTALYVVSVSISFLAMVSELIKVIEQNNSLDQDELIRFYLDRISDSISTGTD